MKVDFFQNVKKTQIFNKSLSFFEITSKIFLIKRSILAWIKQNVIFGKLELDF